MLFTGSVRQALPRCRIFTSRVSYHDARLLRSGARRLDMAGDPQASDSPPQNGSQPDRARPRKRKLDSSPAAAQPGPSSQASDLSAMPSEAGGSGAGQEVLPRGQPLGQFVEQWEFRWDMQRKAYPWEWGSDGRLSDGPHNIIRCVLPAPALCIASLRAYSCARMLQCSRLDLTMLCSRADAYLAPADMIRAHPKAGAPLDSDRAVRRVAASLQSCACWPRSRAGPNLSLQSCTDRQLAHICAAHGVVCYVV
jgi:hypothetical protein